MTLVCSVQLEKRKEMRDKANADLEEAKGNGGSPFVCGRRVFAQIAADTQRTRRK